jgi:hypothetical protein
VKRAASVRALRPARLAAGAALMLALFVCGCGSDAKKSDDASAAADSPWAAGPLVDRLPGSEVGIITMDLALAKRQLGVATDLDPTGFRDRLGAGTPEARFDDAALTVFPYLSNGSKTPLAAALDHGAITAAVTAASLTVPVVQLYVTSQSRASLRRGLAKAGLTPVTKEVYALTNPPGGTILSAVGLGEHGLVVAADTVPLASALLHRTKLDPRLAPLRTMLASTPGAHRAGLDYTAMRDAAAPCVRRIAGGHLLTPGNDDEDLVLELSGEPRASAVVLGTPASRRQQFLRNYRVTDIARDGQFLTLKVRTPPTARLDDNAASLGDSHNALLDIYRCPGAAAARARAQVHAKLAAEPANVDRLRTKLEAAVSQYIAVYTQAPPPALAVHCPFQGDLRSVRVLHCAGTRRRKGRLLHYTITINLNRLRLENVRVTSPDDKTDEIVGTVPRPKVSG